MTMKHAVRKMIIIACMIMIGIMEQKCWAEETIHWVAINYPPAYFVDGPRKGEGFCDLAGDQFRRSLTRMEHIFIGEMSQVRMMKLWKETKETYCIPGLGAAAGHFPHTVSSTPMSIVPPPGIMIRKAEIDRFISSPEKLASVERLLQDSTRVIGIFKEQQYGEYTNGLLKRYRGRPYVYERVGMDIGALLKMLVAKKVDYALMWAFTTQTALETLTKEERESLMFLPVVETSAPMPARAVCNDTPLGRQVIEQINQTLTTEAYKTVVTKRLLEFLPDNLRDEYHSLNFQRIGR